MVKTKGFGASVSNKKKKRYTDSDDSYEPVRKKVTNKGFVQNGKKKTNYFSDGKIRKNEMITDESSDESYEPVGRKVTNKGFAQNGERGKKKTNYFSEGKMRKQEMVNDESSDESYEHAGKKNTNKGFVLIGEKGKKKTNSFSEGKSRKIEIVNTESSDESYEPVGKKITSKGFVGNCKKGQIEFDVHGKYDGKKKISYVSDGKIKMRKGEMVNDESSDESYEPVRQKITKKGFVGNGEKGEIEFDGYGKYNGKKKTNSFSDGKKGETEFNEYGKYAGKKRKHEMVNDGDEPISFLRNKHRKGSDEPFKLQGRKHKKHGLSPKNEDQVEKSLVLYSESKPLLAKSSKASDSETDVKKISNEGNVAKCGVGKEKDLLREKIRGMLVEAGWKIDYRKRRTRDYLDAVYMSPAGYSYWSITKAYKVFQQQFKKEDNDTKPLSVEVLCKKKKKTQKKMKPDSEQHRKKNHKKPSIGRNTLLVRSSNKGMHSKSNGRVPCVGKRTILSWLFDAGVVHKKERVKYMNGEKMLEGWITRDGILCNCCNEIVSVSKFEIHAGSKEGQPFSNICLDSGLSLMQCQAEAWDKQDEYKRKGFHTVDTNDDDSQDDTCQLCADGGDLICCDGCPSTFHQTCLDIEMLPPGDWHCPNCTCKFCGIGGGTIAEADGTTSNAHLTCNLCEKKYHESCRQDIDDLLPADADSATTFCGQTCQELFSNLQKFVGVKHELEGGFLWSLVRRMDPVEDMSHLDFCKRLECNSKVHVALSVMDECFLPIVDRRSGINLMSNVVYNCGSNFTRLNYSGFYTAVLERDDEIISAATIRIHGTQIAEMPFIGTRHNYRRQGMCSRLLFAIESILRSLGVKKLIIPSITEHMHTWTGVFNFNPVEELDKHEMRSINMLVFPGTAMLKKLLMKPEIPKESIAASSDIKSIEENENTSMLCGLATKSEPDSLGGQGHDLDTCDDAGVEHVNTVVDRNNAIDSSLHIPDVLSGDSIVINNSEDPPPKSKILPSPNKETIIMISELVNNLVDSAAELKYLSTSAELKYPVTPEPGKTVMGAPNNESPNVVLLHTVNQTDEKSTVQLNFDLNHDGAVEMETQLCAAPGISCKQEACVVNEKISCGSPVPDAQVASDEAKIQSFAVEGGNNHEEEVASAHKINGKFNPVSAPTLHEDTKFIEGKENPSMLHELATKSEPDSLGQQGHELHTCDDAGVEHVNKVDDMIDAIDSSLQISDVLSSDSIVINSSEDTPFESKIVPSPNKDTVSMISESVNKLVDSTAELKSLSPSDACPVSPEAGKPVIMGAPNKDNTQPAKENENRNVVSLHTVNQSDEKSTLLLNSELNHDSPVEMETKLCAAAENSCEQETCIVEEKVACGSPILDGIVASDEVKIHLFVVEGGNNLEEEVACVKSPQELNGKYTKSIEEKENPLMLCGLATKSEPDSLGGQGRDLDTCDDAGGEHVNRVDDRNDAIDSSLQFPDVLSGDSIVINSSEDSPLESKIPPSLNKETIHMMSESANKLVDSTAELKCLSPSDACPVLPEAVKLVMGAPNKDNTLPAKENESPSVVSLYTINQSDEKSTLLLNSDLNHDVAVEMQTKLCAAAENSCEQETCIVDEKVACGSPILDGIVSLDEANIQLFAVEGGNTREKVSCVKSAQELNGKCNPVSARTHHEDTESMEEKDNPSMLCGLAPKSEPDFLRGQGHDLDTCDDAGIEHANGDNDRVGAIDSSLQFSEVLSGDNIVINSFEDPPFEHKILPSPSKETIITISKLVNNLVDSTAELKCPSPSDACLVLPEDSNPVMGALNKDNTQSAKENESPSVVSLHTINQTDEKSTLLLNSNLNDDVAVEMQIKLCAAPEISCKQESCVVNEKVACGSPIPDAEVASDKAKIQSFVVEGGDNHEEEVACVKSAQEMYGKCNPVSAPTLHDSTLNVNFDLNNQRAVDEVESQLLVTSECDFEAKSDSVVSNNQFSDIHELNVNISANDTAEEIIEKQDPTSDCNIHVSSLNLHRQTSIEVENQSSVALNVVPAEASVPDDAKIVSTVKDEVTVASVELVQNATCESPVPNSTTSPIKEDVRPNGVSDESEAQMQSVSDNQCKEETETEDGSNVTRQESNIKQPSGEK